MMGGSWHVGCALAVFGVTSGLAYAQGGNPVPADIQISPGGIGISDTTSRQEFSAGHVKSFSLINWGRAEGPDAKVRFTCSFIGNGGSITSCPGPVWIPPGQGTAVVYVTATMGIATSGAILITAYADSNIVVFPSVQGRWDLNAVPAGAAFTPAADSMVRARGSSTSKTYMLKNTGQFPTAFEIDAGCPSGLTGCTRTPAITPLLPVNAKHPITVSLRPVVPAWQRSRAAARRVPGRG